MTARLPVNFVDPYGKKGNNDIYTDYGNLNMVFRNFISRAALDSIWVAIEAGDICETAVGLALCDIMEVALEIARSNCAEGAPAEYRGIKVICKKTQNKLFIKIDYTCKKEVQHSLDKRGERIQELIDQVDGYIMIKSEDKQESIRIAVPVGFRD